MKRILVRAPNWIGDQIMAYPFFMALREMNPGSWIGVVCTEWVKDIQYRGLIDEVIILPKTQKRSLLNSLKMIRGVAVVIRQKGPWDQGILLTNSFGSALLFYFSKIKNIIGYEADARGFLLSQKIKWNNDPNIHRADSYLNLITKKRKELFTKFDPVKNWTNQNIIAAPVDPYVVIAPGATADSRRWSTDNFANLINKIYDRWGYKTVIIGGAAEKKIAEEFKIKKLPILDFTGMGSVGSFWKIFKNAQFTVTNESGLSHVAALCGSKVQIICGAADPKRTKPIGPGLVQVLVNDEVDCWPCEKNICKFNDHRKNQCHEGIVPAEALKEIEIGFFTKN